MLASTLDDAPAITRPRLRAVVGFAALAALAAIGRFWALPTRGAWDSDQARDMLVLRDLVVNGVVPLLGPPTSTGTFHHGALYYYLLAPAALVGSLDPVAVVGEIALIGVVAVVLTAAAAGQLDGRAAWIAGVLLAVSATSIEESTFIWNPNLVPASSALCLLAVFRAMAGHGRWWCVAFVGAAVTMQCHVLGGLLLPPVAVAFAAELRRHRGDRRRTGEIARWGGAGLLLLGLSFLPLAANELVHDFSETRAILAYLTQGAGGSGAGIPLRLIVVTVRVVGWPLVGLITNAPIAAGAATIGLLAAAYLLVRRPGPHAREVRWLVGTLAFGIVGLTVAVPSLATVVPRLPVDHYHAFLDPLVVVVLATALGRLVAWRPAAPAPFGAVAGAAATIAVVVLLGAWNVLHWPPAVSADGGWPAGQAAAERAASRLDLTRPVDVVPLPAFKGPDEVIFPLLRDGVAARRAAAPTATTDQVVVVCDGAFREAIGADCGGPAEDGLVSGAGLRPIDRIRASPDRWISVYVRG